MQRTPSFYAAGGRALDVLSEHGAPTGNGHGNGPASTKSAPANGSIVSSNFSVERKGSVLGGWGRKKKGVSPSSSSSILSESVSEE